MDNKNGITLTEIFKSFLKRWYIILSTVVLGVFVAGMLAFTVVEPQYQSTAEVIVHSNSGDDLNIDYNNILRIMPTVAYHFTTDLVLEHVIEYLDGPNLTVGELKNGLNVTHSTTVFYIKISFKHSDRAIAKTVAQQIVESGKYIADEGDLPLLEQTFSIVNDAKLGSYVSPNKMLYLITGFLIGAITGALIIIILEFGKYTYKTKESIENELNVQVIGTIPEYAIITKDTKDKKTSGGKR